MRPKSEITVGAALLLGGALWGLYWIPVRWFVDLGLTGAWPGIAMYLASLVFLLPFVWKERDVLVSRWRGLVLSGMFTGAAFSLYSVSLVYTEVVRSILLFYLTPIWGTLLGLAFLGERLHTKRLLGLLCGIGGLCIVLWGENGIPLPRNIGDWLALASGIAWAVGTLGLYRSQGTAVSIQVFVFVLGALVVAFVAVFLELQLGHTIPSKDTLQHIAPYALLSVIYILPMLFLTIWPATLLSPARVGLLLMSEVVVGLFSAALLSGEPFGWREFLGALLIVSAAILELAPTTSKSRI